MARFICTSTRGVDKRRVATAVDIIDHLLNLSMYNEHRKFTRLLSVSIVLATNFTGETGTVEKIKIGRFVRVWSIILETPLATL